MYIYQYYKYSYLSPYSSVVKYPVVIYCIVETGIFKLSSYRVTIIIYGWNTVYDPIYNLCRLIN